MVLEINGQPVWNVNPLTPILTAHYGKLTLAIVPVDPSAADTTTSTIPTPGGPVYDDVSREGEPPPRTSRVRRARDLFATVSVSEGASRS